MEFRRVLFRSDGVFVGEHGSWNRDPPVGYEVVFVPFRNGEPAGDPVDFVSGFRGDDGMTRGRPVGVTVDPRGALIVRSEEHTSELQSLMRISYAVFCLKKTTECTSLPLNHRQHSSSRSQPST